MSHVSRSFAVLPVIRQSDHSPALTQDFLLSKQLVSFSGLDVTSASSAQLAYLSRMICNILILKSRSFVTLADGVMDMCGYRQSNTATLYIIAFVLLGVC